MDLLEQESKKGGMKKTLTFSISFLVVLLIVIIVAIAIINQLVKNEYKLILNGKSTKMADGIVVLDEQTGELYLPISYIGTRAGYEFFNGEYNKFTEDKTKCYLKNDNQVISFEMDSDVFYKNVFSKIETIVPTGNKNDTTEDVNNVIVEPISTVITKGKPLNTEEYSSKVPIKMINNNLYANIETLGAALNIYIGYTPENKTLSVQTLEYLQEYYAKGIENYGYTELAKDFKSQKAISYGMLIVEKDGSYGVISANDYSRIIGNKYDKMEFIESTNEFLVTSQGKQGVISNTGETRIGLRYDEVGVIDGKQGLYYAINDKLIGVINKTGKVLVFLENENIGINKEVFALSDIKNNLIMYENAIPLKKNGRWGMVDKNGNNIVNFEYDNIGYVNTQKDKSINNTVLVPSIKGIIVGKEGKYGVVDSIRKTSYTM